MRTLYSVTLLREDGGTTIVDYLDALGWRRHELDPSGAYVGVAPATVASLRPLRDDCAASLVHELREASDALGEALDYAPSGPEAGHDPSARPTTTGSSTRSRPSCAGRWTN